MLLGRNGWLAISVMVGGGLMNAVQAATDGADAPAALSEVTITSAREGQHDAYVSGDSVGLRVPGSILDVPQSVEVVSQKILDEQRVVYPNVALRNVSGVSATQPSYSPFQSYTMRGFNANNFYTDGLLDIGLDRTYWLGNIERIEVLKGPASVLYGGGNAGGIIDYVTKKPQDVQQLHALASLGNYDYKQLLVDTTGPVNASRSVTYRVIADLQDGASFIDSFKNRGHFLSGAMHAVLTPDTQLDFRAQLRQRIQNQFGRVGLPAYGTVIGLNDVRLPISRNFNEPFASRTNFEDFLEAGVTHRVNDVWTLKSQFRATYFYYSQGRISPKLLADNRTLQRDVFFIDAHEQDYRMNSMAIGQFDTLGIKHRALLGVELSRHHIAYDDTTADLASINIVNPVHGASPTNYQLRNRQLSDYDTVGVYAQDVVTLLPQLDVVAGMRYDYSARGVLDRVMAGVDQSAYNGRVSPRAGVVYRPVTWAAWYANYSTSFVPVNDVTSLRTEGVLFAPERGQQYETGVKFDVAPHVMSTLAIYQIKRKDVLTTNPVDPTEEIAVGEQRSRGVEWDVTWVVQPGWNVLASYAFTDSKVTKDNAIPVGNHAANVPMQSGRLWTSYAIQSGPARGLRVGAGLYHAGRRYGDAANSFVMPGYTTVDALISYPWRRYRFGVNFDNLLNERYFEAAASKNSVFPGAPLTVMGTVEAFF